MKSIRLTRNRLPDGFLERLPQIFPPHLAEQILQGAAVRRPVTLRANTLKTDIRALMAELRQANIRFDRVAWQPDAVVIQEVREKAIEATAAYREGRLYLQSLSSMVPPLVLDPQPGENVLDLAAAPGSKTTQMAAMMGNRGYILAVEANPIRAERLRFNLSLQGVEIAEVRVADGRVLGEELAGRFDRVLVDAPCSGEGLFYVLDAGTYRGWSLRRVRQLAEDQKRLLATGIRALKPGAVLVYSTCTLSPEENEMVVDWALRKFGPALEVVETGFRPGVEIRESMPGLVEFEGVAFDPTLRRALRILPSPLMEGFFVCKIRATGAKEV